MKKFLCAAALAVSMGTMSCYTVMVEPLRADNMNTLESRQLGLRKGRTTFAMAEQMMKKKGLTGIASDLYIRDGPLYHALAADYQEKIHIFRDNRYVQSVLLESQDTLPYGFSLRFADKGERLFLIALHRDPIGFTELSQKAGPPRIEFFQLSNGSFRHSHTYGIGALSRKMGGLTHPHFVGHSLDDGVLFIARTKEGRVWESAFRLKLENEKTGMSPVPLREAARCSCIQNYIYGLDVEE
ncbi:hypothetical protein GF318_03295 [Candidatus Micrarchaeota archaeon]|nr:hypothetical protein [Candidatus Micrarchaeota archaeon]